MSASTAAPPGAHADASFLPAAELPRGGLSVHGLGEQWHVDTHSGSLAITVPIATSPGRGASSAPLTLSYSSGGGRSAYGFGWALDVPSVTRRTSRRLAHYDDTDTFALGGGDDLVPTLAEGAPGTWKPVEHTESIDGVSHLVRRYRPRSDDTRTRVEWCRPSGGGPSFWRTTDAGNVTRSFGRTAASRIVDPADPTGTRVAEWLLDETRDSLGNVAVYEYKQEDTANVLAQAGEQHRLEPGAPVQANRYLKRIHYANAVPDDPGSTRIQVVLDYGEHDLTPDEEHVWAARPDAWSTYSSGFEVRTWRTCRRILVFHDFGADQGPGPIPRLIRAVELNHDAAESGVSRLVSVRQVGYGWDGKNYDAAALPPLEFSYADPLAATEVADLDLAATPDGAQLRFVDYDGDGLPGVLASTAGRSSYQPPLGGGRFGRSRQLELSPPAATSDLTGLKDVEGTGRLGHSTELPGIAGTAVRSDAGLWERYRPFDTCAVDDLSDHRRLRVDLTGDGFPDVLARSADELGWTPSRGRDGYGRRTRLPTATTEERGPRPPRDDVSREWFSVDMSGDGLPDLVRVRAGRVDYWPNLGWGRYGGRITMTGTIGSDGLDLRDPSRLRFADLDGSGTADLLYLGDRGVKLWRNLSGTAWATPVEVMPLPRVDAFSEVQVLDVLGTGTPALVWTTSSSRGAVGRYLDLAPAGRPHLLRTIVNNLGARTAFTYDTSTLQALQARRDGAPWLSTTSSTVSVVARVQLEDEVAESSHVTRYRYRDAYPPDPVERSSFGFAQVETSDAELIGTGGSALDLPPVRVCEWFALGRPGDRQHGVFAGDAQAAVLAGPERTGVIEPDEYAQSARSLSGRLIRTETYVDDGTSSAPVVVAQTRYRVRQLQPSSGQWPGVFRVEQLESLTSHYEQVADDPRVSHELTLSTDEHGTPSSIARVAYPRRVPVIDEQNQVLLTWTRDELVSTDLPDAFRVSEPCATEEFEITGVPVPPSGRFEPVALAILLAGLPEIDFAASPIPGLAQARRRSAARYEFWDDSLGAALPAGQIGHRGLTRRVLRLALTDGLVSQVLGALAPSSLLTGEAGYVLLDGDWWTTDGLRSYDPAACYLPVRHTTPFGNTAEVVYDAHNLLVAEVRSSRTAPLSANKLVVVSDYSTLAHRQLTDANGGLSRVAFDPLGRVTSSWRQGSDGTGDTDALPGAVYTYGADSWYAGTGPGWAHSAVREVHADASSPWQEQRLYVDGLGRIAMTKTSCSPGEAWADDGAGGVVLVDTAPLPRWVGTGRTVFDNKGNAVEQYEPYFAVDSSYDAAASLTKHTVLQLRTYDALGRLIRVDHPDGTVETVEIGPWQQVNADRNDTVLTSGWYSERQGASASVEEQRAAVLAAGHADTPQVQLCDPLGRFVRIREDNGPDGIYETRHVLDIAGELVAVHDARGVRVAAQVRDAAGRVLRTESVDAGTQLALPDAAGRALRHLAATGHLTSCHYDLLGRATQLWVREPGAAHDRLVELTVFGEAYPHAADDGLVGQVHRRYDEAGLAIAVRYDAAGNLVEGTRQLLSTTTVVDWSPLAALPISALDAAGSALLDPEKFTATGTFDALGRSLVQHLPDGTQVGLEYDADGLDQVHLRSPGAAADVPVVTGVQYDARRRRTEIEHGNGVAVEHEFDPCSGRATTLRARRGGTLLQQLGYTYDPVGNVVEVVDGAAQTVFFAGTVVAPGGRFTYDAAYRLRTATGREHASLGVQPDAAEPDVKPVPNPNDPSALRRWTETYAYDEVGNLRSLAHTAPASAWTRRYEYAAGSNRLTAHSEPGDPVGGPYSASFGYDAAGQLTGAPHLASLTWDHAGRLVGTDLGGGGTVLLQCDGGGNRVRKIVQRTASLREEYIYLGDLELFRRYRVGALVFERRTVRVLDGKRTAALVDTITVDTDHPGSDRSPLVRYQITDLLGSSAVECDEAGAVIAAEEYHPFGTTSLWLASGQAAASRRRYRFLGKEKDEETGFYRVGVRYYCCWLGRWISPDPGGLIDGVNRYSYAGNNPVSLADHTGLAGEPPNWKPLQMWLSESLKFAVKANESGKFTDKHYEHGRQIHQLWGGPNSPRPGGGPSYDLGHPSDMPLWKQKAGQVSEVSIQDWRVNNEQSVQEGIDRAAAVKRGEFARTSRKTTEWVPGVKKGPSQPKLPSGQVAGIKPTKGPGTDTWTPATEAWKAEQLKNPSVNHIPKGQAGEQLKLPGTNSDQLTLPFNRPAGSQTATAAPKPAPSGSPQQLELFKPPDATTPGPAAAKIAKPADVVADTSAVGGVTKAGGADAAAVAKSVDHGTGGGKAATLVKDASGVTEVTKDAAKVTEVAKEASVVTQVAKDANAVSQVAKDASLVTKSTQLATDAKAVGSIAKTVTPVVKTVAPAVKEAGALTKVVSTTVKVATPVVKVLAPVAKVLGEVAKPLGVAVAAVDVATAHNNTDRLVASGDLAAGVAMYCGPVGEAFSAGYTVGGLADKGIEKASKAALGVDLSPSNGISKVLDVQDKVVSAVIPDDPKQPAYKNENKLAWFLIDHLGF